MAPVDLALYETTNTGSSLSTLAGAFGAKWHDIPNDKGEFRFELPLGDADVALCTYGRIVRFGLASAARWAGVIDFVGPTPIDERTEGIESVLVSGYGLGVELDEAKTRPKPVASTAPGALADIFPPIDDRPFEWFGVDYDDSGSDWIDSTERGTHGESSAVSPGLPGGMRVLGAKWIWSADVTGPEDDFLFFREWVFLDPGFYCIDFCAYDAACYINGRRHPRNAAYNAEAERIELTVINGGYVLLAFEADLRDPTGYDEGLIWQITEGQEGALVYASGSDCQVYDTADAVLTMNAAEILLTLKTDHDALDDWTFDFTTTADSDSNSLTATSAVTARIGDDSLWDILLALSEVYIDFDVDPTGKTLHIWEKGTHPAASTMDLIAGGSTAAASGFVNIKELSWEKRRAEFNALLVRYESGWFERPATLPANPRWHTLGIEHVASGATAIQFADAVLDALGVDQDTATIGLVQNLPADQLPYVGFDKWSIVDVPSDDDLDVTVALPVAQVVCSMDADGELVTDVELGSFVEDKATRIQRWIARSTRGGLSGLVQMAQGVTRTQQQRTPGLNQTDIVLFDSVNATSGDSASRTMPGKGLLHKLRATVEDPTGGTSSVDVTIGGVTTTLTGTTGAGFALLDIDEGLSIPYDPRTVAVGDFTTVGHVKVTVYAAVSETR